MNYNELKNAPDILNQVCIPSNEKIDNIETIKNLENNR